MKRTYQPSVTAAAAQCWLRVGPKAANAWPYNFGQPLRQAVPLIKNG